MLFVASFTAAAPHYGGYCLFVVAVVLLCCFTVDVELLMVSVISQVLLRHPATQLCRQTSPLCHCCCYCRSSYIATFLLVLLVLSLSFVCYLLFCLVACGPILLLYFALVDLSCCGCSTSAVVLLLWVVDSVPCCCFVVVNRRPFVRHVVEHSAGRTVQNVCMPQLSAIGMPQAPGTRPPSRPLYVSK